jgi:hypothetical protein
MKFYNAYKKNIYSQNGEDGIIEEILKRLNIKAGWCVEFGAADGIWKSNTFNLITKGFNCVMIESDSTKFELLKKTAKKYPKIIPINSMVDSEGENTLDNIISKTDIPLDYDLCSIDVDGPDYFIWKAVERYKPKIVIIEINSKVNPNEDYIHNPHKGKLKTGFRSMLELGESKGYNLLCHTGNLVFIRNDLIDNFNDLNLNPIDNFNWGWIKK